MNFLHNIMNKLGRYRLIPDRRTGADYMHRYYLFLKDRVSFPFNVTLHHIVRSDDPIMHDHPWDFTTIILKGGYWEHVCKWNKEYTDFVDICTWRGPGSVIRRSAKSFHWLELDNEKPATTLFFMGKQQRKWGFLLDKVEGTLHWVESEDYLDNWKDYHLTHVAPNAATYKR